MNPPIHHRSHGAALIVVLFFVILITVVTVGFLESARLERSAAGSHFERMRAATLARDGVESVVAILRRETTDPARNWISQPGALIVSDVVIDPTQKQLRKQIPLSSGVPSSGFLGTIDAKLDLEPPELNVQTLTDQNPATYLLTDRRDAATGAPVQMKLRWIYVRKDGAYDLDAAKLPVETPVRTNKTNPIVGRFAYWADDESSRINYNIAWKRNTLTSANKNTAPVAHPSRINLTALTLNTGAPMPEALADTLHNWTAKTPGRFFNSFADARQVSPEAASVLNYNKFELTHFNHDPDTTFFGENRILLTTNADLVPKVKNADGTDAKNADGTPKYAREFLDILRDDKPASSLDPGKLEDIAGAQPDWILDASGNTLVQGGKNKLDPVVRNIIDYISKKDWPISPPGTPTPSYKEKYYPGPGTSDGSPRLAQIAINIIDYVRAKESKTQIIAPLRFALDGSASPKYTLHPSKTYGAANSYQGLCRSPYITEAGMWMEKDEAIPPSPLPSGWPTGKKLYKCYFKYELFLPKNYGFDADGIELVPDSSAKPATGTYGWFATWTETRDQTVTQYYGTTVTGGLLDMDSAGNNASRIYKEDITGGKGKNGTSLTPGNYVTITKIFYRDKNYAARSTISTRMAFYYGTQDANGFLSGNGSRWPRVNIATQAIAISYKLGDPSITTRENMPSIEVDDPRCNVHPNDWTYQTTNSFGKINAASTIGKTPTKSPTGRPQQDTDANGMVSDYSLYMPEPKGVGKNGPTGDNGRVTSIGELGYVHTGNEANNGSTPWRTIRLQPNNYVDNKTLPDWAFMDLFASPSVGATGPEAIFTPHGTAVGGRINVNSHVDPFSSLIRDRGLVALLAGSTNLPFGTTAEMIAGNIYRRTLATGTNKGKVYGYPWVASPASTDPNAFDTPGEICEIKGVADAGEKSEELVRDIASLVTSRGNVFSIYTVGQALKQTPDGRLIVTAEQRQHAIVERYLDNRGTPVSTDDEVRFRPIYFRNLTP